uniref:AAA_34 domain-containing protein n=1 Tax=Rhabditophanes sp. KR3021 TaxID=114890 RepID=A0AC35TN79_9BILA
MDDLLTAALAEAGLDEFISAPNSPFEAGPKEPVIFIVGDESSQNSERPTPPSLEKSLGMPEQRKLAIRTAHPGNNNLNLSTRAVGPHLRLPVSKTAPILHPQSNITSPIIKEEAVIGQNDLRIDSTNFHVVDGIRLYRASNGKLYRKKTITPGNNLTTRPVVRNLPPPLMNGIVRGPITNQQGRQITRPTLTRLDLVNSDRVMSIHRLPIIKTAPILQRQPPRIIRSETNLRKEEIMGGNNYEGGTGNIKFYHTTNEGVEYRKPSNVPTFPPNSIISRGLPPPRNGNRLPMNGINRPPIIRNTSLIRMDLLPEESTSANNKLVAAKEEMKAALKLGADKAKEHMFEDDEENLGHAETYADYKPAKLRSGNPHPDSVVETASLSSVAPPDVRYQVKIPEEFIDQGTISALQLEVVIYACQMHENMLANGERAGFFMGDGAGIGKGRTIASIIYENYLHGRRKALWLSVSTDLRWDTERDLRDIGADLSVVSLNKLKYAKINGPGPCFIMIKNNFKKGVIFATYSSLIGECRSAKSKYRTRLKQLLHWFGSDYDGPIIFDECHKAKNLCPAAGSKPTKTGKVVMELQNLLPNARIVYASATGATEPKNMAYMTRLGLWGKGQSFPEFSDFINAVERRGVGAMELVAMDMKQRGLYLARQLSFRGVTFRVEEVALADNFIFAYDESVKIWLDVRRHFQKALAILSEDEKISHKLVWGQFWAAHQRFFKYLCIAAKVQACVNIAKEALKNNKCVVIGLQSTGEARTLEQLEENGGELTEFVSTAKAVLQGLIEKHFPTLDNSFGGKCDIFSDFDRMLGTSKGKKNNKRKKNSVDTLFDEMDEFNSPAEPKAKRNRLPSNRHSSSDEDSDSDDDEDDDEIAIGNDEESWQKLLEAEAQTSSEEDDSDDSGSNSETESNTSHQNHSSDEEKEEEAEEEEFNPFMHDFTATDPWADKQTILEEGGEKLSKSETREQKKMMKQMEKEAKRKQKDRKKRKKQKRRDKIAEIVRRKEEMKSDAMKSSAQEFMLSSKILEHDDMEVTGANLGFIKTELLAAVERLGDKLPPNTLDQLIDELGGPEFVAEMTGRKGRVVTKENGEIEYQQRHVGMDATVELMNVEEKHKFMNGEKLIAIISEAASSGISLQADRRAVNTRRRVHITMELPWSADKAIQQFGRTHRSNQVSAPEYLFLISELAGEKRFASIVAKRLESLGALTHGDRRATESRDLSQFNLDNKYGRQALEICLKSIVGLIPPFMEPPANYKPGNFFSDMNQYLEGVGVLSVNKQNQYSIERDGTSISKFLNRLLGLPVHAQNALFDYFTMILTELIKVAKHDGTFDMGIMDIGTGENHVRNLETRVFAGKLEYNTFRVEMQKISVERGMSWEEALCIHKVHNNANDGFYICPYGNLGRHQILLVCEVGGKRAFEGEEHLYSVTKPQMGRIQKLERLGEILKRHKKVELGEAEEIWKHVYEHSATGCQHKYYHGKCKIERNTYCEIGRRTRTFFVLSGSVLSVWPIIEDVLSGGQSNPVQKNSNGRELPRKTAKMQVVRVRTNENQKIVGLSIQSYFVRSLVARLESHCGGVRDADSFINGRPISS